MNDNYSEFKYDNNEITELMKNVKCVNLIKKMLKMYSLKNLNTVASYKDMEALERALQLRTYHHSRKNELQMGYYYALYKCVSISY